MYLSVPDDVSFNDEAAKQFFLNLHKVYMLELLNPFYRDGAAVSNEAFIADVQSAVQ